MLKMGVTALVEVRWHTVEGLALAVVFLDEEFGGSSRRRTKTKKSGPNVTSLTIWVNSEASCCFENNSRLRECQQVPTGPVLRQEPGTPGQFRSEDRPRRAGTFRDESTI